MIGPKKRKEESCMKNQVLYYSLLTLVIFAGIVIRAYWMVFHFTHYDDIGLISCLVRLIKDKGGMLDYFNYGWTYAPFQVVYTQMLVNPEASYLTNIVMGRFLSFLCGILSILAAYCLLGDVFEGKRYKRIIQLIGVGLMVTSWENIIYSAQAEPYEIGVLFVFLLTIYLLRYSEKKKISVPWLVLLSVISFYSQYHSVIFIASLYLSLFITLRRQRFERMRIVAAGVISGVLCFPLLQSFMNRGLLGRGFSWNAGINQEFIFPFDTMSMKSVMGSIQWFAVNTFRYIKYFFVSNQFGLGIVVLTTCFGIICLLGFVYVHRWKFSLALYLDIAIIVFVIFVVKKKLAYSPSRHTLLFYPVVLLLFCAGVKCFLDKYEKKSRIPLAILGIGLTAAYVCSSIDEIPLRKNELLTGKVEEYIQKYQPDNIIVYYGFDPQLMKWENYQVMGAPGPLSLSSYERKEVSGTNTIMLLGINRSLDRMSEDAVSALHEQFKDAFGEEFYTKKEIFEKIIDSYIKDTHLEVEYCRGHFSNSPSGVFIYILKKE